MDGNGRWAKAKNRPRSFGHQAGLKALRNTIEHCVHIGVKYLTVFAFSSENWNRPDTEVSRLMDLFLKALNNEVAELHDNGICIRFIGNKSAFNAVIRREMSKAEILTHDNRQMVANIAVNYGGRWDIVQAARKAAELALTGDLAPGDVDEDRFSGFLALADSPDPDLLIRTGGETRISNFLLWQSAYTEFFFTPVLWPDFNAESLDQAITEFQGRERRYGKTGKQLKDALHA